MELYVLDNLFRRVDVVDRFDSLIWTERFAAAGDFELVIPSSTESRNSFLPGTWLATNESYRCMIVDTVEDTTDEEGRQLLTVKGSSLEMILDDRVAVEVLDDLTTHPKWTITGLPAEIARKIFNDICVLGLLDPGDVIPYITDVAILPDDTIPEPSEEVTIEFEPKTVYEAIKAICELYDLGFRLLRNLDNTQLVFDIYTGSDRTSQQSILPSVLFSIDLDNMTNTTQFQSTAGAKNVAYVFSPVGFEMVYPQDVDPEIDGFERRVLMVKADDIDSAVPATATALMIQRGKEELSKHRSFNGFDGEISQNSQYKYGVDYQLGDLTEARNKDGFATVMRVTEQIFVSDGEGERTYPTLTISRFITPGSWQSWEFNQVWLDLDDDLTLYWASL